MISRVTRMLLLIQAIVGLAIVWMVLQFFRIGNIWLAVALALALVLTVRFGITVNNFMMAWRHRSPLPDDCALGWTDMLRLVLGEYLATMWSSSWTMPFFRVERHVAAQAHGLPVLLIHGYGCNSGYWRSMSRALERAGISHHAVDLEPVFGSIDAYADLVDRAVERLRTETGSDKVVIVAHSMGGLATRAYMRAHGDSRIARAITLGTPHHGTALARHGIGENTLQMGWTPGGEQGTASEWLRKLAESEPPSRRALFVSIFSHHDNIISPQMSSWLPGARNVELHGIGHVALALHPRVQSLVIEEVLAAAGDGVREQAARRASAG